MESGSTGALPNANGTVPAGSPQAYAPLEVVQSASVGGGVQTSVTTVTPSTTAVFDPQASFANQDGLVAARNVDLASEFVGQLLASYSYAANAIVLKADDRMTSRCSISRRKPLFSGRQARRLSARLSVVRFFRINDVSARCSHRSA